MLSQADNELLTRAGPARRWATCCAATGCRRCSPRSCLSATGRRRRSGSSARTWWPSAPPRQRRLRRAACPHRGANLDFGRNEECGIRCAFHGWKFDVEGNCVDLPTSPPESIYKETIKLLAYPTREWADMIWVYMGPRENMPELPQLDSAGAGRTPLRLQEVAGLQLGAEPRGRHRHRPLLVPARHPDTRTRRSSSISCARHRPSARKGLADACAG